MAKKDLLSKTNAELEALAKANSANWAGSDAATRAALHEQNTQIRGILDARNNTNSTFDSGSGTWRTVSRPVSTGSGGVAGGGYTGAAKATTPSGQSVDVSYVNGILQNQENVPNNTVVHAQNGQDYVYTKSPEQQANDYIALYSGLYHGENSPYSQAAARLEEANRAATQRAVNSLRAQKDTTADAYANYYRQAYIDKMNARKNLDQRLASQGITGGMAETTRLGYDTAYSDAARQLAIAEARDQAALDQAITDAQLSGDYQAAQAAADTIQRQTDSYANVLQDLINRNDQLTAQQAAYDREDAARQLAYQREDEATRLSYARALAQSILSNGQMPDDETLAAAGLTKTQAQLLLPQVTAQGGSYRSSGGSSGRSSGASRTYNKTQAQTALEAILRGSNDASAKDIVEAYYNMPIETILSAYGVTGSSATETPYTAALNGGINAEFESGSGYNEVLGDVQALRANETSDAIIRNVIIAARQQGKINNEQAARLLSSFTTVRGAR